jgi:hypothetical protein
MKTSHLWWSSVGKKLLNGLTGLALIGFVCVHLAGNLTLYARWSRPPTSASTRSSWSAPAWPAAARPPRWRAGLQRAQLLHPGLAPPRALAWPRRAASTRPRTTRTTATASPLFYDTVKGGDFRAREANVHRLAEVASTSSTSAWPRACPSPASTAACWPTAPSAAPRSAHLLRPRPDRPAAAARRYSALMRQVEAGTVKMFPRREMLDLVLVDGAGPRHRLPQPGHRRDRAPRRRRGAALPPAATPPCSTSPPTPSTATPPPPGAATSAGACSPTPASRRSTPPASPLAGDTSPSSR